MSWTLGSFAIDDSVTQYRRVLGSAREKNASVGWATEAFRKVELNRGRDPGLFRAL
ncbi:MAG: hypothetical protein O3B13_07310 [Planctomycetota bacterium]|nr:hypothetical protein [Planctomycetota bacterium]